MDDTCNFESFLKYHLKGGAEFTLNHQSIQMAKNHFENYEMSLNYNIDDLNNIRDSINAEITNHNNNAPKKNKAYHSDVGAALHLQLACNTFSAFTGAPQFNVPNVQNNRRNYTNMITKGVDKFIQQVGKEGDKFVDKVKKNSPEYFSINGQNLTHIERLMR